MPSPNHNGPIIDRDATAHWDGRLPRPSAPLSVPSGRQARPVAAIARLDHRSAHRPIPVRRPRLADDDKDGDDRLNKQKKGYSYALSTASTLEAKSSLARQVQGRARLLRSCTVVWRRGWGSIDHRRRPHPLLVISLSLCLRSWLTGLPMKRNGRTTASGGENRRPCNCARAWPGEDATHRTQAPSSLTSTASLNTPPSLR